MLVPVLLTLLLGMIDTGLLLATKNTVSYASRQGGRLMEAYGTTAGADATILQAMTQTLQASGSTLAGLQSITFFRANPSDVAPSGAPPGQTPAQAGDSTVHEAYAYVPSSNSFTLCAACDTYTTTSRLSGDYVGVTIRYRYSGFTPLFRGGFTFSDLTNAQVDPQSSSYSLPTPAPRPTLAPPPPCPTYTPLPTYTPASTGTPPTAVPTATMSGATATPAQTATPAGSC